MMNHFPSRAAALALLLVLAGCSGISIDKDDEQRPAAAPPGASSEGRPLRIDADAQARIGLRTAKLEAESLAPELKAYGRLEEDPASSFVVRAPIAGIIRPPERGAWPTLGATVAADGVVGRVEPRYPPTDQINLTERLLTARADLRASAASADAARAAYDRTRALNADNKNMSDRALQEAKARLEAEAARLEAAKDVVRVVESTMGAVDPSRFAPLTAGRGGEVTEVLALPGEDVAAGEPLLRVAGFEHLLASVTLPLGENVPPSVRTARIVPVGSEDVSIPAELAAMNAAVDPAIQGRSLLFRLSCNPARLRPGQAVTAYLPASARRVRSVVIPASAVVRHMGESFAYVHLSGDEFERRRLQGLCPAPGGYALGDGLPEGAEVVVEGAQLLLSEELKSRIASEDDE